MNFPRVVDTPRNGINWGWQGGGEFVNSYEKLDMDFLKGHIVKEECPERNALIKMSRSMPRASTASWCTGAIRCRG
jgi:hypothetical protein